MAVGDAVGDAVGVAVGEAVGLGVGVGAGVGIGPGGVLKSIKYTSVVGPLPQSELKSPYFPSGLITGCGSA